MDIKRFLLLSTTLVGVQVGSAATVTSTADSGPGSLREAIANAVPGEVISFAVTGTITLTSEPLVIDRDLVINGPGATNLVIQRSAAAGTPEFRIFNISAGMVSLSGLAISNGKWSWGAGIVNNATLFMQDCDIVNNVASLLGGGILNVSIGTLTMTNCVVSGNRVEAEPFGGGAAGLANYGSLVAIDCIISSNSVATTNSGAGPGGIANLGTAALTNCIVESNVVLVRPGEGIWSGGAVGGGIANGGIMVIHTTTIRSNAAMDMTGALFAFAAGGGISSGIGITVVERSTISGNVAIGGDSTNYAGGDAVGGGIANYAGLMLLENTTISGNAVLPGSGIVSGKPFGGGVYNEDGSPYLLTNTITLRNSTITGNKGEGVRNYHLVDTKNTIIAGNDAEADIFTWQADSFLSGGFNLLGPSNVPLIPGPSDQVNVSGPAARLGPLRNNGGPTFTHSLLCGSPAINAGDSAEVPSIDQRGFARIVDGAVDIGAFEFSNTAPTITCPGSITNCTSTTAAETVISVNLTDAEGDPLTLILTVDGSPVQTNDVPPASTTNVTMQLTTVLAPGEHQVSVAVFDPSDCSSVCSTTVTVTGRGDLYPIALHQSSLVDMPIGGVIPDISKGGQSGNFGWLTWAGSSSERALVQSLTAPGDSGTYVNPRNTQDHVVSVGDWVQGRSGVANGDGVRSKLEVLKGTDITVPVCDQALKESSHTLYHVVAFARIRITDYRLPQQNRISARLLGLVSCD